MIVYNLVSRLAVKTVDSLQGLLMTQLSASNKILCNIPLNVTTKNVSRYRTMDYLGTKNIEDLQGLLIDFIEQYPGFSTAINLNVTAPASINHNTWQRLTDRLRTWGDIDGLLISVLEISARSYIARNSNIKIIKPGKNYSATLKLIRVYNENIKLLNKFSTQIKE